MSELLIRAKTYDWPLLTEKWSDLLTSAACVQYVTCEKKTTQPNNFSTFLHENLNEQIDDVRLNLKGNWKVVDFLVSCYPMCRILANS